MKYMPSFLKRDRAVLFLVLIILAVVLMLFLFAPNTLRLSPQEFDYTGLGLPGIIYAIQSDMVKQLNFFEGGLDLNRTGESCKNTMSTCQLFQSEKIRIKNPSKLGPLEMKSLYNRPDVQAALARLEAEINAWALSVPCPDGCAKTVSTLNIDFYVQPAPGHSYSCSNEGKTSTKHISASSASSALFGRCILAGYSAASKFQEQLNAFLKETCGSKCGHQMSVGYPLIETDDNEKECKVSISSTVTVTCTGRPVSDEYDVWIEAYVCVSCEEPAKT